MIQSPVQDQISVLTVLQTLVLWIPSSVTLQISVRSLVNVPLLVVVFFLIKTVMMEILAQWIPVMHPPAIVLTNLALMTTPVLLPPVSLPRDVSIPMFHVMTTMPVPEIIVIPLFQHPVDTYLLTVMT